MPRVDICGACGLHGLTVEAADGRVCVRCLRTYYVGAELQSILAADDEREDAYARSIGVQSDQGYCIVAADDKISPA